VSRFVSEEGVGAGRVVFAGAESSDLGAGFERDVDFAAFLGGGDLHVRASVQLRFSRWKRG
jgi:hypothetical protein